MDINTMGICHLNRVKLDDLIEIYSSCKALGTGTGTSTGTGKAIPVQAWVGPGGSRLLGLPDFKSIDT